MKKSPRFEEIGRIAELRKHYSKYLARDIKHEQLLRRQPNQFLNFS